MAAKYAPGLWDTLPDGYQIPAYPTEIVPLQGAQFTEVWSINNLTPDSHAIHTHLFSYKVLARYHVGINPDILPGGATPKDYIDSDSDLICKGWVPPTELEYKAFKARAGERLACECGFARCRG